MAYYKNRRSLDNVILRVRVVLKRTAVGLRRFGNLIANKSLTSAQVVETLVTNSSSFQN